MAVKERTKGAVKSSAPKARSAAARKAEKAALEQAALQPGARFLVLADHCLGTVDSVELHQIGLRSSL